MQQSHIKLQSHSEPSARKLRVTESISVCDVNNDRILHWLSFYMRSASLHNKPNGLQIRAPIIYLMDHWRLALQAPVLGLQMLGLSKGKDSQVCCSLLKYERGKFGGVR